MVGLPHFEYWRLVGPPVTYCNGVRTPRAIRESRWRVIDGRVHGTDPILFCRGDGVAIATVVLHPLLPADPVRRNACRLMAVVGQVCVFHSPT